MTEPFLPDPSHTRIVNPRPIYAWPRHDCCVNITIEVFTASDDPDEILVAREAVETVAREILAAGIGKSM